MKNKELIKILSEMNPEAEVGYECLTIARAHADVTGDYIDLSGERHIEPEKVGDTGVFVLLGTYIDKNEHIITEVTGVYATRDKAEQMGEWLLSYGEFETPEETKEGYIMKKERYIAYHINNNYINK